MPELKRLFVGAKMDKDSDERFVSNGDYTDAVNIDIISSEGGDAGVVRNKKGNTKLQNKSYNSSTQQFTAWAEGSGSTAPFGFDTTTAKVVGILKDTPTNTIYYFVNATGVDFIAEYSDDSQLITPVLVDVNNILNFDPDFKITGIQVAEGILGWVQEDQEPKTIDIETFKAGSTDFVTQTQYEGRDFILSDVTMIRLGPLNAPTIAASDTLRDGIVSTTVRKNFTVAQLNDDSISATIAVGTQVSLSFPSGTAFIEGDKLQLITAALTTDTDEDEYEVSVVVTSSTVSGSVIVGDIITATPSIQDNILTWEARLVEGKPLFELEFPRFAYRWKYKNGQYSTYSPFSDVVFLPTEYSYDALKGYNTGMTNTVRKITISGFDTPPADVEKIEILYKGDHSLAVYAVEKIDPDDTEYIITDELFYKVIEENQLLRPWDAVPRSATALEMVGNRFVLANYKQNYNVPTEPSFAKALINSVGVTDVGTPETSIKSLRTYQAGVIFKDELGRETPVFSNKSGVVKTTLADAATRNQLVFQMQGDPPVWATHFKYFIKDIANEYYNLAADRLYQSEDQLATWVSFPSSERNKVSVDTYLIAKKKHDRETPVIDNDNKYKIIDIQDEAPAEIATKKQELLTASVIFDTNFGDGNTQTERRPGSTPTTNSIRFLIASDQENDSDSCSDGLIEKLIVGNWIKFKIGTSNSKYYKIANVERSAKYNYLVSQNPGDHLAVTVTEPFGDDTNFLYTNPEQADSPLVNTRVNMGVYEEQDVADQQQFLGRFFVKLASNNVLNDVFTGTPDYIVLNSAVCYDGGYINTDINFKIHGGGKAPRAGYSVAYDLGGLNMDRNPDWANDDVNDVPYDIVFEKRHASVIDNTLISAINTPGTKIRFSNHSTIYTIDQVRSQFVDYKGFDYTRYWTLLDKRLEQSVNPQVTGQDVRVEIVGLSETSTFSTNTPAVFETEPAANIDLNLYYEASGAYPVSEYNDEKVLSYYNCFTFGNGVESNRIRDDYNAYIISKGPKVSTVLEDTYKEEHVKNGMIWSGIINPHTGVNNLNQFLYAEPITKNVSPIYGSIQKLRARDTDLIIGCEDKILQALADKDALYNADGSVNITASNAVIGDIRPYVGEFGVSTDPASWASYGFRDYFTDKKRGVVCRLSRDGITPIVKGYENELETEFASATTIVGSFDDELGVYNVTMNGKTHQFSEESSGWTSTWTVDPDFGITLNNVFYSTKNGILWKHDDTVNRNQWYGASAQDSSIKFVFNEEPSTIKKFLTLSYEGDEGWIADAIETDQQSGRITSWKDREGKFYNYIKGLATTWGNTSQSGSLDTKEFSVQGIGNLVSITGDTATTEFTIDIFDDPVDH